MGVDRARRFGDPSFEAGSEYPDFRHHETRAERGHDADVLDVLQVARLLGVGRNTIYTLVGKNQIPHRRLGKAIRFSRAGVMSWLASWSSRDAEERH